MTATPFSIDPCQNDAHGKQALIESVLAVDELRTYTSPLSLSFSDGFVKHQQVNLIGNRVESGADLALIHKLFTDSRLETLRILYLDENGKIISFSGLSTRFASCSASFDNPLFWKYLRERSLALRCMGASNYYLVHERPSGRPTPNLADVNLTKAIADHCPGMLFAGHLVIGRSEFSQINRDGEVSRFRNFTEAVRRFKFKDWASFRITTMFDVVKFVARLREDDGLLSIAQLQGGKFVRSISALPGNSMGDEDETNEHSILSATIADGPPARLVALCAERAPLTNAQQRLNYAVHVSRTGRLSRIVCASPIDLPLYVNEHKQSPLIGKFQTKKQQKLPPLPAPLLEAEGLTSALFPETFQYLAFALSGTATMQRTTKSRSLESTV